jgi:lysophospholipase L1-like esterase
MNRASLFQNERFLGAMKTKILIFSFAFLSLLFVVCINNCKAGITKYVAIGDSLTAGFQNGALFKAYQKLSFPNLIAKQLGIEDFQQPLISHPGIPPVMTLISHHPLRLGRKHGFGHVMNANLSRSYDNLGIPAATLCSALNPDDPECAMINPFIGIVLGESGNIIKQALSLAPDLVTFWLGNNEIFGPVMNGKINVDTVFPPEKYALLLDYALSKLSGSGTKIVIANIYDVTLSPYVMAIPMFIINPHTGKSIKDAKGNSVAYLGPEGPLTEGWKITQGALGFINRGYGIPIVYGGNGVQLSDELTLSPDEISFVKKMVIEYNDIISKAAKKHGAVLVDMYSLFNKIAVNGYTVCGIKYTIEFPHGGLISLDGIHPSALGYAIIANEFIQKINEAFEYDIPRIQYKALIGEKRHVSGQILENMNCTKFQ